jgi:hypothetical protein
MTKQRDAKREAREAAARVAEAPADPRGSSHAAERVTGQNIELPIIGHLPFSRDQAAFYAGLGAMAAVGLIDWPVAAAVGAGHWLVHRSQSGTLRAFGEALDEA